MPTGIYIRTKPVSKKARENMSKAHKGKHQTEETRRKISKANLGNTKCLGYKQTEETIRKRIESRKGYRHSEETKIKVSKNHSHFWKGKKMSKEHRLKLSECHKGEKGSSWKGGINPINDTIRKSIEFRLWREAVFARDDFTCQKTKIKGFRINAHHIQNFSSFPELRFKIDNGITLSKKSHQEFHKIYGIKNNTQEQLKEFLQ